jgi:hypothetical protein
MVRPGAWVAIPIALVMLCFAIQHLPNSTNLEANFSFIWIYLLILVDGLIRYWPAGPRSQRSSQPSKKDRNRDRKRGRKKLEQMEASRPFGKIEDRR